MGEYRDVPKVYDTPKGRKIYSFLRRTPRLTKVRGFDEADQEIVVTLVRAGEGQGSPKWKDAIGALYECIRMQGLNEAGEVVRTLSIDPDQDPALREKIDTHEAGNEARAQARQHGSTLIAIDVPRLVDNIARNMKEVAESSAAQQATAFKAGFEAMTNVINLCLGMLQRVDDRLENLEQNNPEPEQQEEPEQDDGQRNQLAHMALMQALQGQKAGGAVNPEQAAALTQLLQQYLGGQKPPAAPEPNGHAG